MRFFPVLAVLGSALFAAASSFGAKPAWKPVTPEELREAKPTLEPEAAAEILFREIEVDDGSYPYSRTITEYIRYKIYAPERAEEVTRISGTESRDTTQRIDLQARLVLPDGRTQEFGKEAIKERALVREGRQAGFLGWLAGGGEALREKFLAIPGIEAGAVLEYRIIRTRPPTAFTSFVAQQYGVPVRQYDLRVRLAPNGRDYLYNLFVVNQQGGKIIEDKKARTIQVTAAKLPSIATEPFVGPETDYALTVLLCYEDANMVLVSRSDRVEIPDNVPASLGPWAYYSTLMNWAERDRGYPTKRSKALAQELVAGAASELEKAQRIHRHVQNMYQGYAQRHVTLDKDERRLPGSLNDVLDWEGKPEIILSQQDFLWLAVALYQAAGLDAHTIMLPDRSMVRFDPKCVSRVFLSDFAAAIRLNDEWCFSMPQNGARLPFGLLPWEQDAQVGLLALNLKQEFIPVPSADSEKSEIVTHGDFALDTEGGLSGEVLRHYTGHPAVEFRQELRRADPGAERNEVARKKLGLDPAFAEVTVKEISDIADAESRFQVKYDVKWPNYAVRTKNRMIVRPAVLHVDARSPFVATERHLPLHFPYRWREVENMQIKMPPGYAPEAPSAPTSSPGKLLHYKVDLSYSPAAQLLVLHREFTSNAIELSRDYYAGVRAWYANVEESDQHEIVFARVAAAKPTATPQADTAKTP